MSYAMDDLIETMEMLVNARFEADMEGDAESTAIMNDAVKYIAKQYVEEK